MRGVRRSPPRAGRAPPSEARRWCVHLVDAGPDRLGDATWETDRARFIGRGRSVRNPAALDAGAALSGTTGAVLDPIFAVRARVRVNPGQAVSVTFTTLVATSRESAFALADRYHGTHAAQRALDLAWSATKIELQALGLTTESAALFQDLATQLLFQGGSLAPPRDEVARNRGSQPRLWSQGLSGEVPIVLATIDAAEGLPTLRELFDAHRYWRLRGLTVDLVVVNAQPYDYFQELRDGIVEAMTAADDAALVDQPGGVFVRRRDVFQPEDYLMLSATARIHIPCDGRSLARIMASADASLADASDALSDEPGTSLASIVSALRPLVAPLAAPFASPEVRARRARERGSRPSETLRFGNGIGGLTPDGDYLMVVDQAQPPARAVGERHRKSSRGIHRIRAGHRLHLGGECVLLPPDPVAQ